VSFLLLALPCASEWCFSEAHLTLESLCWLEGSLLGKLLRITECALTRYFIRLELLFKLLLTFCNLLGQDLTIGLELC